MRTRITLSILVALLATLSTSAQKREVKTETQTKRYYIEDGKKKYVSNSKTQKMWDEILQRCPACIEQAQKYNVNIWQNDLYEKKSKATSRVVIKENPLWPPLKKKQTLAKN